jgi:hypothetical protein
MEIHMKQSASRLQLSRGDRPAAHGPSFGQEHGQQKSRAGP